MKPCPKCHLESPDEAAQCDCGLNFLKDLPYKEIFRPGFRGWFAANPKKFLLLLSILPLALLVYCFGWVSTGSPETRMTLNLRMPPSVLREKLLELTPL